MTILHFCTLNSRSVIELSGPEAEEFLQGLITNDITAVSQSHAIYSALLTPQGKILFDFFISSPQPGIYWLECSREQSADLAKRLTFYKLRANVTITPLADNLKITCIWGQGAQDIFDTAEAGTAGAVLGGFGYIDPRTIEAGVRLIATDEEISQHLNKNDFATASVEEYTAHRVQLGLADTDADIGSSQRFAHECNLDMTNGVDFSKGCYVGQEVVSRMHHKQAARKRILAVSTSQPLATGDSISANDKTIGEVLTTSGNHALAAIRLDRADSALSSGSELTVEGTPIKLNKPHWVKFTFPGENNNE